MWRARGGRGWVALRLDVGVALEGSGRDGGWNQWRQWGRRDCILCDQLHL